MNQQLHSQSTSARPASFTWSLMWLSLVVAAAAPIYSAAGYRLHGTGGILAALLAGLICWTGAALALASAAFFRQRNPLGGVMLGMLFRMGLPLILGGLLEKYIVELRQVNIFGFVLTYYFLTLIAETLLAVRLVPKDQRAVKTS